MNEQLYLGNAYDEIETCAGVCLHVGVCGINACAANAGACGANACAANAGACGGNACTGKAGACGGDACDRNVGACGAKTCVVDAWYYVKKKYKLNRENLFILQLTFLYNFTNCFA